MSFADILRNGIALARGITLPLHVTVTRKAWTGQTFDGVPTYATTTPKALVEFKQSRVRTKEGVEVISRAYVAFLEELPATAAAEPRENPVDTRDIIILPDGSTGPILAVDGFLDGGTGVPFYSQIFLG